MKLLPADQLPATEDRLKVELRVGEKAEADVRIAECGFGTDAEDELIAHWDSEFSGLPTPRARDAAEFGALASKRWRYYRRQQAVVRNFNGLVKTICERPNAEIAMLAVMRADWFAPDHILGVCHFRRTWSNSLYVDFLAKHPLLESGEGPAVAGVGLYLTAFVVRLAKAISATRVWGESAEGAAGFWQSVFRARHRSDAFRLSRAKYRDFLDRAFSKGSKSPRAMAQKAIAETRAAPSFPKQ